MTIKPAYLHIDHLGRTLHASTSETFDPSELDPVSWSLWKEITDQNIHTLEINGDLLKEAQRLLAVNEEPLIILNLKSKGVHSSPAEKREARLKKTNRTHSSQKLSDDVIETIKDMRDRGHSTRSIAAKCGVSKGSISNYM